MCIRCSAHNSFRELLFGEWVMPELVCLARETLGVRFIYKRED